jgi:hypothetical protein
MAWRAPSAHDRHAPGSVDLIVAPGRAAVGRPSLAREFGRMNAELARLRALLREHGIDPGDGAAAGLGWAADHVVR